MISHLNSNKFKYQYFLLLIIRLMENGRLKEDNVLVLRHYKVQTLIDSDQIRTMSLLN